MLFQKLLGAFPVQTGFPLVNSPTLTILPNADPIVVNLPSGIVAGNGLIIIVTQYDGGTFTTPTGWTLINSTKNTATNAPRTAVYARVATGTEGSTVTISTNAGLQEATAIAFRVTNWFGAITAGIEATAIQETTTTPNPPSETASWGSADNLWIAYVGSRGSRALTAYPTNYNLYQTQALNPLGSDRGETFMAGRELATATEDPSAFTFSGTAREVVTGTLAIRGRPFEANANIWLASSTLSGLDDNTRVTNWINLGKDGSIYNATGTTTAPIKTTLSGIPTLQFNATTDIVLALANAFTATSNCSFFIVGYQTANRLLGFGGASPNGNSFWGYSGNNGVTALLRNTSDAGLTVSSQTSVAGLKAYGVVKTGTTSTTTYDNSTTGVGRAGISGNFIFGKIGTRDFSNIADNQRSTGYIAEVLYFDSALSATDAATVMTNLRQRNGIA